MENLHPQRLRIQQDRWCLRQAPTSPEASGAGNSAPPIAPVEEEKGFWSSAFSAVASLDAHEVLDAVGMVPGLGIAADLSNAALYAYEKDLTNAAISLTAASPIGGQAATAAKHATKAAAKVKVKKEAAEAAAKKADAPPPSKPSKKDKDNEEPKEGEGKDGGYVEKSKKKPKKLREQYLGRTPSKKSRTGREVQDRIRSEGKLRDGRNGVEFKASNGNWYPLKDADMGHTPTDAVSWWKGIMGQNPKKLESGC